jgi:hypothetical protein
MLRVLLSVAIILIGNISVPAGHMGHDRESQVMSIAHVDRTAPGDHKAGDQKLLPACSSGMNCLTFIVPAVSATAAALLPMAIGRARHTQLAATVVAPPLPPPKSVSLV